MRQQRPILTSLIICVFTISLAGAVWADVTVPTLFSDYAVLQRDMPVPVWGTASPGESVTIEAVLHQLERLKRLCFGEIQIVQAPLDVVEAKAARVSE